MSQMRRLKHIAAPSTTPCLPTKGDTMRFDVASMMIVQMPEGPAERIIRCDECGETIIKAFKDTNELYKIFVILNTSIKATDPDRFFYDVICGKCGGKQRVDIALSLWIKRERNKEFLACRHKMAARIERCLSFGAGFLRADLR